MRRSGYPAIYTRIGKLFLCLGAIALVATVGLANGSAVEGQVPNVLPKPEVQKSGLSIGISNPWSDIATADVYLDGHRLFAIAAPAVRNQQNQNAAIAPVQERVETIQKTLDRIANSQLDINKLEVTSRVDAQSGLPVISVGDRYLMTVTTLDAQLQGQEPQQRADALTPVIKEALLTARQERQPDALIKQAILAVQLLLSMAIASWIVSWAQNRLKTQERRIVTQFSTDSDNPVALPSQAPSTTALNLLQAQMNRRQQLNLNEVKRRLLQLMQLGIWGGGSFVILGLFPYTRWLQPLILPAPLKLLGILLSTYVAIRISDVLIDRFFAALSADKFMVPERSQRLALRVSTFSRVLRSFVAILFIGAGGLSILSLMGVELGPILAGAGILGLAISLASQNVIKDMINGFLILLEDQYAVGDVIQVGKMSGFVESMNLRITQLRNGEGRLITIPNSSIAIVENLSKDWSRVDLAITIAYDAEMERAIAVIRQVGETMTTDPAWRDKIPESPEVLGVEDIGNAGITIRVWIKTLPLQQWQVAREFRRRLKHALDDQGIAIGLPQQSLWFHSSANLNKPLEDNNDKTDDDKTD
jgi:small conductance mechanosensitive channel